MENMKIALVTGAMGGIGTEICRQLVEDGFKVLATHRPGKEDAAQQWLEDESFDSGTLNLLSLDVTDSTSCVEALKQVMKDYGTIDVLVNNAGITRDSAFKRMTFNHTPQHHPILKKPFYQNKIQTPRKTTNI